MVLCLQKSNSSVEEMAHTIVEKKGVPDIIGIFTYFLTLCVLESSTFVSRKQLSSLCLLCTC